jgi:hypothetical protein
MNSVSVAKSTEKLEIKNIVFFIGIQPIQNTIHIFRHYFPTVEITTRKAIFHSHWYLSHKSTLMRVSELLFFFYLHSGPIEQKDMRS